jgi:hypothetical protein
VSAEAARHQADRSARLAAIVELAELVGELDEAEVAAVDQPLAEAAVR